jgi:hypothetical protein
MSSVAVPFARTPEPPTMMPPDTLTMTLHALNQDAHHVATQADYILALARKGESPVALDRRLDHLRLDAEALLVEIDEARGKLGVSPDALARREEPPW